MDQHENRRPSALAPVFGAVRTAARILSQHLPFRGRKSRPTRASILVTTVLFTAWCGYVVFGEPLEDIYRGARNLAVPRSSDDKVVIVRIDDTAFDKLGLYYSETYDAAAIHQLKAAGARKVFFDRAFKDVYDRQGSDDLISAIKQYPGDVYFGAINNHDPITNKLIMLDPNDKYKPYVRIASLNGISTPFSLSSELNYADYTANGKIVRSISAEIAGVNGPAGKSYRPDLRIRAATTPRLNFLDAVNGNIPPGFVAGKDVIIGPDSVRIKDYKKIIGQGWIPGVYIHAMGAQTLREGPPTRASWLWPYAAALILSLMTLYTSDKRTAARLYALAALCATTVPFVTDALYITVDYVPAVLLYGIIAYRSHSFKAITKAETSNADTLLPNLKAMREDEQFTGNPVAALMIKNYANIFSAYPDVAPVDIIDVIVRAIQLTDPGVKIYQDDNILYWKPVKLEAGQLRDHIEGIAKLIGAVKVARATIDLDVAVGIDLQSNDQVIKRINGARMAAAKAAADGVLLRVNEAEDENDAQWRLSLMSELDQAIEADDLYVVYQPQLDLNSQEIASAEALVRWTHATRGPVSPAEFIEQAEATNRIERLTFFVLEKTIQQAKRMRELHPNFAIAVNMSTKLLGNPGLPYVVLERITASGLDPNAIKLEITETAAMTGDPMVAENLEMLAGMGMTISIDDYGTGHATLEYLRTIPFKEIKIDREFVQNIRSSKKDEALVRSTIGLAHALGHTVTAEGIEDEQTLRLLRRLKCDHVQGYHIARPMPGGELEAMIQHMIGATSPNSKTNLAYG